MTLRIAILGAGRIGQVHARAVGANPNAQLVAVTDVFESAAQALAETYGAQVRDIDSIESAADVDAVIICTPTDTHADLIERFAKAGKAIFCEKPVDLSAERVRACLKTVSQTDAKLMIGFNRRFDPHFQALKATIEGGDIGEVEQITITSRDPGLPPHEYIGVSGGIFRDMTIHDFDMARFLLDEEIVQVYATAAALVDPSIRELDDYDTATVVLTTASGKQATILNSRRASYGYDQRIEVHGSKGMVQAENQRPVSIEVATAQGYTRPTLHDFFMTRYIDAYAAELNAFMEGLKSGTAMAPNGQDGLDALTLADAALESVRSGKAVSL
jgi:myo-inositol 2-dehydrogenase/D-chiro-inositol 1-dehydrogenase